jgi:hypothetical protein
LDHNNSVSFDEFQKYLTSLLSEHGVQMTPDVKSELDSLPSFLSQFDADKNKQINLTGKNFPILHFQC